MSLKQYPEDRNKSVKIFLTMEVNKKPITIIGTVIGLLSENMFLVRLYSTLRLTRKYSKT